MYANRPLRAGSVIHIFTPRACMCRGEAMSSSVCVVCVCVCVCMCVCVLAKKENIETLQAV